MARIPDVPKGDLAPYYRVADELVRRCLREGRSLLTGEPLWTVDHAVELRQRVIEDPDESAANFDDKLRLQTADASDAQRLFAAELRLLHLLPITDMAAKKKRDRVQQLLPPDLDLPTEVIAAFGVGVAKWGAGHAQAWHQFSFIIRAVEALAQLAQAERASVVDDPWRFKSLLEGLEVFAAQMEREALLFVAHPDTFDAVFNGAHKDAIVSTFQEHAGQARDRDRALLAIREALTPQYGENFNWYVDGLVARWHPSGPKAPRTPKHDLPDLPDIPGGETARRRLRVARWVAHVTTAYAEEDAAADLAGISDEVVTRFSELPGRLQERSDPSAELGEVLRSPGVPSWVRTGALRVYGSAFLKHGGREAVELLAETIVPPRDVEAAERALRRCTELADRVGSSRSPVAAMTVPFLTACWALQAPDRWAPMWWAAQLEPLDNLGWIAASDDNVARYLDYQQQLTELTDDLWLAAHAISGVAGRFFLGLDPSLGTRAAENVEAAASWHPEQGYLDVRLEPRAIANARTLVGELRNSASGLVSALSEVLEVKVRPAFPRLTQTEAAAYRGDAYVAFAPAGAADDASFRIWVTSAGVWVGALTDEPPITTPAGFERVALMVDPERATTRFEPLTTADGRVLTGRRFELSEALDRPDFAQDLVSVAAELVEILHVAWGVKPDVAATGTTDAGSLATLVERWKAETDYPTAGERAELDHLAELTRRLAPARLAALDEEAVRELVTAPEGGAVPPAEVFLRELRSATGAALQRVSRSLHHLLWSDHPLDRRFDDVHGKADGLGFPGLEGALLRRLLSRAPDGWLPIIDLEELRHHADRLGLEVTPAPDESLGRQQAALDSALQTTLTPVLGHDTAAMAAFLRWHASTPDAVADPVDAVEQAANDLYVPVPWLRTVEELLRDKGQLILYGPPGTGKTYLAQRLAKALTSHDDDRRLVQFHPSTSYEDFFEGYRPQVDDQKQMTYQLAEGPLARAAKHAAANRGRTHVLVIDEINRANLPRVLGELLFLLEYRDESVHTLYRSDRPFRLPPNLLIIGTMNTADRSIAMIDAALRRRFHFVPLFPHEPPIDELLERWGADHGLDRRWVELLAMVNRELADDLGGPDLQVGPSHLMKADLTAHQAERIWTYSIFPYIEDQLFGRPDRIKRYRWDQVVARLDEQQGSTDDELGDEDGPP